MRRLPLSESVVVAWLTGWKSALETEDLKVRATVATCENGIDHGEDVFLIPESDSLARDRDLVSRNGPT